MMHYRKGENVERETQREDLPFADCMTEAHKDFLWMHVKGGTKVNNVVTFAKNALDRGEYRTLVWSGSGGGVVKTISCAEIMKRTHALYQVTRMSYTTVEEHWKPQMEGLEEIVANRQIPSLHILMSLNPIEDTVNGLQKPNSKTDFWSESGAKSAKAQRRDYKDGQNRPRPQTGKNPENRQQHPTQREDQKPHQKQQKKPKPRNPHPNNKPSQQQPAIVAHSQQASMDT